MMMKMTLVKKGRKAPKVCFLFYFLFFVWFSNLSIEFRRKWLQHMVLAEDGFSDPPGL